LATGTKLDLFYLARWKKSFGFCENLAAEKMKYHAACCCFAGGVRVSVSNGPLAVYEQKPFYMHPTQTQNTRSDTSPLAVKPVRCDVI